MTELLFWSNVALTGLLLIEGFWQRIGYLQVPFLSALIYAAWYLPQAAVLVNDPSLPNGSLANVLAMSLLSLVAIWAGWRRSAGSAPLLRILLNVPARLIWPTLILTLFVAGIGVAINAQPEEARLASQWTGPLTILAFFARVGTVSLVLSLALVLQRRTILTMTLAGVNILFYAGPLLISFRRQSIFEFTFTVFLCLFFLMGRKIPRALIVCALAAGFAIINGVGHLRDLGGAYQISKTGKIETHIPTLSEILEIDWFDFKMFEESKYQSETHNAAIYMSATDETSSLYLGAEFWNALVFAYVPGQIIGFDFKKSSHDWYGSADARTQISLL